MHINSIEHKRKNKERINFFHDFLVLKYLILRLIRLNLQCFDEAKIVKIIIYYSMKKVF